MTGIRKLLTAVKLGLPVQIRHASPRLRYTGYLATSACRHHLPEQGGRLECDRHPPRSVVERRRRQTSERRPPFQEMAASSYCLGLRTGGNRPRWPGYRIVL